MPNLDKAAFTDSGAADAHQVGRILRRYNSPFAGQERAIIAICEQKRVNPLVLLAVMQEETVFGTAPNLKRENLANPFSIHFSPNARGIAKLAGEGGQPVSFARSLEAAGARLAQAGMSATPLYAAAALWGGAGANWAANVQAHYNNLARFAH